MPLNRPLPTDIGRRIVEPGRMRENPVSGATVLNGKLEPEDDIAHECPFQREARRCRKRSQKL
jgi:hypothetical protein